MRAVCVIIIYIWSQTKCVYMQVLGNVPTISIDKTDGCQVYLSDKSLDVEIVSSKSSEMNVLIPQGNGDYVSYKLFFLMNHKLTEDIVLYVIYRLKNLSQNNTKPRLMEIL